MRKIVAGAFVSLDGVMQAPGGPEEDPTSDFKYGGWTAPYWDGVIRAAMDETLSMPFDLLLGRKTYDIFAAHWPHIDVDPATSKFDPLTIKVAKLFNHVTKYVATHSPSTLAWQNSKPLGSDIVTTLRDLKKKDGPNLLIQGSSNLIQALLAHDLIDEFRLLIFPLVLGKGKRLFGEPALPGALKLIKAVTSSSGVLIASYERAGQIKTGSFALETPPRPKSNGGKTSPE